jgi:group I intron endonuclease
METGVYILIFPNGKRYVGYSLDKQGIKSRWSKHKWEAFRQKSKDYNSKKNRAIRRYGWNNIHKKILVISDNEDYCKELEIKLIAAWNLQDDRFGYNCTAGGDGQTCRPCSQATKDKISVANKGKLVGEKHHMAKVRRFMNEKTGQIVEGLNNILSKKYGWNVGNMSSRKKSCGWSIISDK